MHRDLWPELAALYDTPPELSSCPLYSVHVDERDTSLTLGFETGRLPDRPKPEWAGSPYDTFVFFLLFTGVEELRMTGIAAEDPALSDREVGVTVTDAGRLRVSVTSGSRSLTFSAAASTVALTRVYLQGPI
uniref:Immunity 50 family protein n=1 Tax=Streptomyces sp. NBC_00049 TaxID=2903617 RepID=A0AAU2JU00_9ACTN